MSFLDIEKLIGSPMQIPLDLNSGYEYYQTIKNDNYADDEMSDIDEMSDNSIEYFDPDDDYQHKQKQFQQQKDEEYNNLINSLRFMSLNEQQIMLYQKDSNHCIIQMEF